MNPCDDYDLKLRLNDYYLKLRPFESSRDFIDALLISASMPWKYRGAERHIFCEPALERLHYLRERGILPQSEGTDTTLITVTLTPAISKIYQDDTWTAIVLGYSLGDAVFRLSSYDKNHVFWNWLRELRYGILGANHLVPAKEQAAAFGLLSSAIYHATRICEQMYYYAYLFPSRQSLEEYTVSTFRSTKEQIAHLTGITATSLSEKDKTFPVTIFERDGQWVLVAVAETTGFDTYPIFYSSPEFASEFILRFHP